MTDASRRPTPPEGPDDEGRDDETPHESWLSLDDDELLRRIQNLDAAEDADEPLLEIVASDRHFFVRQEAAKRVKERRRLYAFEDDRHVGQILTRHLSRREDITYLERISMLGRHVEVRQAAQVQLARVWRQIERSGPREARPLTRIAPLPASEGAGPRGAEPEEARPAGTAVVAGAAPVTSSPLEGDEVDGSLLGWAVHFLVERAWNHLGTKATLDLLAASHRDLVPGHPTLALFEVREDARVKLDLESGPRIPRSAVRDVAMWMAVFRKAAAEIAPQTGADSVRDCTALMGDALRAAGFYTAFEDAETALSL